MWVCGRSLAEIVGSDPTGGMDVCCEFCVLSGRGLCVGLITCLEEPYRVLCVCVLPWNLDYEEDLDHWELLHHEKNICNDSER